MSDNPVIHENTTKIPAHTIDTWHMPAERSRELWRDIIDGTYHLDHPVVPGGGHRVNSSVWLLDELLFSTFSAEANSVSRTRDLINLNPMPVLKVRMYRSGYSTVFDGERSAALGTGAVHFIDHDRPIRQISSDHEQISVFIPHHLIGYDPSRHRPWFSIGLDTPAGRLLETGLLSAFRELDTINTEDSRVLSAALIGLIRGTLSCGLDSSIDADVHSARLTAIKQYLDRRLGDPVLDANDVLRDFGISRTTLYRDFAESGGLQKYILERRLERAYKALSEAGPVRGIVQATSDRYGFSSLAYFSRCFRERYSVTPSAILGQWNEQNGLPSQVTSLEAPVDPATSQAIASLQRSYKRFR
jgi:AraC-like DNA-binding protein